MSTVPAVLERMARQLPNHDALVSPDRRFTFGAAAGGGAPRRRRDDRAGCRPRRPGGDLVAEHLALGGGLPGRAPCRRRDGASEHALHRRRGDRHPRPHRRTAADRDGPVPRHRPGRRVADGRAAGAAPDRAGSRRGPRRRAPAVGRVHGPRHRPRCGRRRRGGGERRRRQRHPVHVGHHGPQQRRAVRAPAVAVGVGGVGGLREDHQ